VMAIGAAAQRRLSMAFERREVDKRYVAVVAGALEAPTRGDGWGDIELPLAADWPHRPRQRVDAEHGKPSHTRYRVVTHDSANATAHTTAHATTRVELQPLTGRTHQLRVHLMAIGHPIAGDALYAPPEVIALAPRLLLHASALAFMHPTRGESMVFTSTPDF
ncbi:MAG: RluA family pseudouridine synthase, partial [Burkholderiaceae bacterium]|nr:RluA family pseudouridine synthase [Burkholderiaceae bacterium]